MVYLTTFLAQLTTLQVCFLKSFAWGLGLFMDLTSSSLWPALKFDTLHVSVLVGTYLAS